jgi:hypothetical protein
MNNMNIRMVVLALTSTFALGGCQSVTDASKAMGSTGTGVIAGTVAGAGVGIACDQLTKGRNTGACVAAGVVAGAAVGALAASWDEEVEKSVPVMDCQSVKKRMNYSSAAPKPKAALSLGSSSSSLVSKPGQKIKLPLKVDIATPGSKGKEPSVPVKIVMKSGTNAAETSKTFTFDCGGDRTLPLTLPTDKEGVYNSEVKLVNASDNSDIEGAQMKYCYTVDKAGVDKCNGIQASNRPIITKQEKRNKRR